MATLSKDKKFKVIGEMEIQGEDGQLRLEIVSFGEGLSFSDAKEVRDDNRIYNTQIVPQ